MAALNKAQAAMVGELEALLVQLDLYYQSFLFIY
jgi:hypothetical protein